MTSLFAASIASCVALLVPAAAEALDRYAEPNGNGPPGTCPQANPCGIQDAVEDPSVADGDRILLLAGANSYVLGANQLLVDNDITIEPAPGTPRQTLASTFAGAGGAVQFDVNSAADATIRRVLISHDSGATTAVGLFLFAAAAERVHVVSEGLFACSATTGSLTDSVCFLTADASPSSLGAAGLTGGGAVDWQSRMRNVTAISKAPNAPAVTLSAGAGADLSIDARNVIAVSENFDVFASAGAGSSATISLATSSYGTFDAAGAGGSVTPNTVAGNQAAAPAFANFTGNNFRQAPSSPTVDAGSIDPFIGSLDLDDNPRTVQGKAGCANSVPDIGAYEAPAVTPLVCDPPIQSTQPQAAKAPQTCRKAGRRKRPKGKAAATAAKGKKKPKKRCGKPKRK